MINPKCDNINLNMMCNKNNKTYVVFGNKYFIQFMDFNYKIINENFENDKVWIVIFKSSTLTTLKTMVEFNSNSNMTLRNWLDLVR